MDLVRPAAGAIAFGGRSIAGIRRARVAALGIAFVRETRGILHSLTVAENLALAEHRFPGPWMVKRVLELFSRPAERISNDGGRLSGGERQVLAIARARVMNSRILLLDEPRSGWRQWLYVRYMTRRHSGAARA